MRGPDERALIDSKVATLSMRASAKVVRSVDESLGALLDEIA